MRGVLDGKWAAPFALFALFLSGVFVAADLRLVPTRLASLPYYDTLGHFILYGIFAALLNFLLQGRTLTAVMLSGMMAVGDEFSQTLIPSRSADLADLSADLGAIVLFSLLIRWRVQRGKRKSAGPYKDREAIA